MSGKRRFVVIPVDDERATSVRYSLEHIAPEGIEHVDGPFRVPVPPDDQLTREIEAACNDMEDRAHNLRLQADLFDELSPTRRKKQAEADTLERRMEYLRAAFSLNKEDK